MSVCSDGNNNLFVSDLNRVSKVVHANYLYFADAVAGRGGSTGKAISASIMKATEFICAIE